MITNKRVCNPIIIIFVDNFNIFVSRKSGIILHIKNKLALIFNIVYIGLFTFSIRLKVTYDWEKKTIKLF